MGCGQASGATGYCGLLVRGPNESASSDIPLNFLPLSCQHCARPACLRACPVAPKAISKDPITGIVSVNEDACVGCGECVTACPYGAMGYDADGHHAVKCDLCAERRAGGEVTTACASVCPTRAIQFGDRQAFLNESEAQDRDVLDFDPFLLDPATVYLDRIGGTDMQAALNSIDVTMPRVVDQPATRAAPEAQFPYGQPRAERQPDRIEPGGCNICFNCCTTQFHFRDDKLVKITGNPDDPILQGRVCPKSQLSLQLYGSENRLTQPLKRVGERGENRFEPISWSQALDEIAARLKTLVDVEGPETLGIFSGTRTGTLTNRGYIRLFGQMFGTPNIESTEPFCSSGKNMAYNMTQGIGGSGNSYTEDDLGSAELYVYIGDNQAETRPVHFGMINDWRLRHGARMIVVDPRLTVTASKADAHLAIRPGTDMALMLGVAHHILTEQLHDQAFCDAWVLGWEHWRDHLIECDYSPEWAASVTDLDVDAVKKLARDIATADGCVIFGSRGINQHVNSVQTNRALMFGRGDYGQLGSTWWCVFQHVSKYSAER